MYKSVIREGKFLVLVVDGVFDVPFIKLPTEELADKVAFELQTAWDQGVEWGAFQYNNPYGSQMNLEEIRRTMQQVKCMSPTEREAYQQRTNRRNKRIKRVEEARRWEIVLSWKR